jgi:predicted nucleotidyltransferase
MGGVFLKNISSAPNIQNAIDEFCTAIRNKLKENILEIKLFGSVAKGTNTFESDIDIFILLRNEDFLSEDVIADTTVDINLKYDVVIAVTTMGEKDYAYGPFKETLFYKNIQQEGLPV